MVEGGGRADFVTFSPPLPSSVGRGYVAEYNPPVAPPRRIDYAVFHGLPTYEQWEWKSSSRWDAVPIPICLQIMASRDVRRESSTTAHVHGLGETKECAVLDSSDPVVWLPGMTC